MGSFLVSACGSKDVDATTTLVERAHTLAVVTFSSGLTQTAMVMPTITSTPTRTPTPASTVTLALTKTPGAPGITVPALRRPDSNLLLSAAKRWET